MRGAAIQMTSSNNLKENLVTAGKLIQQAAEQGAQFIVLPEMFALMGVDQDKVRVREEAGRGPIQDFLATISAKNKVWVVGGTIPLVAEHQNKVRAACLVFDDQGKQVARYDKVHLFDVSLAQGRETYHESHTIEAGGQAVVVPTPFGKLGLAVCYDLRFPELFRMLLAKGAELIAVPAAFTLTTGQVHWETLMRARAIENLCYLIAACQTGTHSNGRKTFGHSMVVDPWGKILQCLAVETGTLIADIDLGYMHEVRKNFPALQHRRF